MKISEVDAMRLGILNERLIALDNQAQLIDRERQQILRRNGLEGKPVAVVYEPNGRYEVGQVIDEKTKEPWDG